MRKIKRGLQAGIKQVAYSFKRRSLPFKFLHQKVPYFSQWESPALVKSILTGRIQAEDDPEWKNSGAETKEEYTSWSWSGCGMACTKMIIAHQTGKVVPLVELGKKCVEHGAYTLPLEESPGLIYASFITFLEKEFGLRARTALPLLVREMLYELSRGNYVIASVDPSIRHPKSKPKHKGGHLVLVLGYDLDKQKIYLHNPSGFVKETQEYAAISFNDFKKFFSGRGIVIHGR